MVTKKERSSPALRGMQKSLLETEKAVRIPLTKGMFALVDASDFQLVSPYVWHAAPSLHDHYAVAWMKGTNRQESMHRFLLAPPRGLQIDHINHNGLDNRRANLRQCTVGQNHLNARMYRSNLSGYKGVHFSRKMNAFVAKITVAGQVFHLGNFTDPKLAFDAYCEAARSKCPEFCNPVCKEGCNSK